MKENFKINPDFDWTKEYFLKTLAPVVQHGTQAGYRSALKGFLGYISIHHPEVKKLSDLKRSPHIEGWLSHMTTNGFSKGTRRHRIVCVRRFLHLIYEWEWKDVPEPGLVTSRDMPSQDKYLPRPFTPEMDMKLQEYLRNKPTLMAQAILLLRKTGMRIGELGDLELNCLEKLHGGHYVLHVPIGKLHTERVIPVDDETVEVISRIKKLRGHFLPLKNPRTGKAAQFLIVFGRYWRRPSYAGFRDAFVRMIIASGIKTHVTPHQLRHTYATEMLRGGLSLPALMKLLGHKDISMTLRYAGVSQVDLQNEYYNAINKNKSVHTVLQSPERQENTDKPDALEGLKNTITKLQSAHKDSKEKAGKKKLQRMLERLRRISRDIDSTLKD